jgi:NADPH-dependent 2,4-dienoyl-CoA reductase/sulfur reductase-like enzyme
MSVARLVVVGASLAGLRAVQAARDAGFAGSITLVGDEEHLPYDRTALSKGYLASDREPEVPEYHARDYFTGELDVGLVLGRAASRVDTESRHVEVAGRRLGYDALVIATGARARSLPAAGRLAGVHTLRRPEDAAAIRRSFGNAGHLVVVGGGFVGSEVASSAHARGLKVTVVDAAPIPLSAAVGRRMGQACSSLHSAHGTDLRTGVGVRRLEGDGRVERVVLTDGTAVGADLVVVGIGAMPATDWLAGSGVAIGDGVLCDENLMTSVPGVYAAGDLARWRSPWLGRQIRVEHWATAAEQGAVAGRNAVAAGDPVACDAVPYFWSDWYGNRIQCAGVTDGEPEVVLGDVDERRFVALYRENDRIIGALAMNDKASFARYRGLLRKRTRWEAVGHG